MPCSFVEQIAVVKRNIKLQVFASDVDPDAIASAREGLYPETIDADVSAARLARFFSKEEHGYRISPELRATVVFTVQDVLGDPPFSRIDLVSCRNLLIYLGPEAQAKILSLFHFALREGGLLLLGNAETIGIRRRPFRDALQGGAHLPAHRSHRPGDFGISISRRRRARSAAPGQGQVPSRQAALADLCRRMVMETYAPAAILINRKHECLYFLGPTDRYLRVAPGHPTHDLLAMVRQDMRAKLRSAMQRASQANASRRRYRRTDERQWPRGASFRIDVRPVYTRAMSSFSFALLTSRRRIRRRGRSDTGRDMPRVIELEQELEATQEELQGAIRNLEISGEEQKAINEEALSVNEEYQSTNEELLTSKEELQSLNEELTALNSQLQETLERQRTTSNDLQNVLYSTDVATLFLDAGLNIRFFTPATKSLFNVIPERCRASPRRSQFACRR